VHTPPPRLPIEFAFAQPLLDKMLAKRPEDRFPDMKSFARELKNVLVGSPVLQRRLQIEPGENLSEKLRAMGFSDTQMQSRASTIMPGAGEVPAGVLVNTLLERSELALEPVVERRPPPKQEVKKSSPMPYIIGAVVLVLVIVVAAVLRG
jgi:hypothetical protein